MRIYNMISVTRKGLLVPLLTHNISNMK